MYNIISVTILSHSEWLTSPYILHTEDHTSYMYMYIIEGVQSIILIAVFSVCVCVCVCVCASASVRVFVTSDIGNGKS